MFLLMFFFFKTWTATSLSWYTPCAAHRLLSKKIILALSVCLCASDRHGGGGAIPVSSLLFLSIFFWYLFYKMGDKLASFFFLLLFSLIPGLVVCVCFQVFTHMEHIQLSSSGKWSKKWAYVGVAFRRLGRLGWCEIVGFKEISGNWN